MKDINYNRIAIIENYPKLDNLYKHYYKLHRATHDSWPALFNTNKNKLRVLRCKKMCDRFIVAVQKEFNIREYEVLNLSGNGDSYGKLVAVWIE